MKTLTKPKTDDVLDQWPPLAHLVRGDHRPVRRGDRALCGAKLMGIELGVGNKICKKCVEIARRMS